MRRLIRSRRWLMLAALALLSLALGSAMFSGASFTSQSSNSASLVGASINLSSSEANQAIVSASEMEPGDSRQGTVEIKNQGNVTGDVTLKATNLTGTTLASAIDLRVDETTSGTSKKWSGKLSAFPSAGVDLSSIAVNSTRKFRFTLSWPSSADDESLQGLSTSLTFLWEGVGS